VIQDRLLQATSTETPRCRCGGTRGLLVRAAHNQTASILVLSDGGDNHSRFAEAGVRRFLMETAAQVYAVSISPFFDDSNTVFGQHFCLDSVGYRRKERRHRQPFRSG